MPQFTSLEPVDSHALILKRGQVHQQTALRNTRGNRESFSIGDRVAVRDKDHARWERLGQIKDDHVGEDNKVRSYTVEMDDGAMLVRNARYLHR